MTQLPSEWWDRTMGESRFKLAAWLPRYIKWYLKTLGRCFDAGYGFRRESGVFVDSGVFVTPGFSLQAGG